MSLMINMTAFGTGGTENSVSQIDIPDDGRIVGVQVSHQAELDADGDNSAIELGFIATNQKGTNDTRSTIVLSRVRYDIVTSGGGSGFTNFFVPLDLPVSGGERLHAHVDASAGVATTANFIIQLETRRTFPRRSARR